MQYNVNARMILLHHIHVFYDFYKLVFIVLSTSEVLYLQKQPLVGAVQKWLFLQRTVLYQSCSPACKLKPSSFTKIFAVL